jgi:hypothetical protein
MKMPFTCKSMEGGQIRWWLDVDRTNSVFCVAAQFRRTTLGGASGQCCFQCRQVSLKNGGGGSHFSCKCRCHFSWLKEVNTSTILQVGRWQEEQMFLYRIERGWNLHVRWWGAKQASKGPRSPDAQNTKPTSCHQNAVMQPLCLVKRFEVKRSTFGVLGVPPTHLQAVPLPH